MEDRLLQRYFPMKLPADVQGYLVEEERALHVAREIGPAIFDSREAMGYFTVPQARRLQTNRLEKLHRRSDPMWILLYEARETPVGWFYGYMEDEICYFMDTVALIERVRRQGIYTAFLRQLLGYLEARGYERLATSHHPNNRGIMIAELKVGFNVVGLELHESHGPLLKMVYFMHGDRREGFRRGFHMAPEPGSGAGSAEP